MASLIYLDTHVAAWLYAQGRDAVPQQVAQAILFDAPLVTRDAMIHASYARAVWD